MIDDRSRKRKELVAGCWLWQVESLNEAIERIKRSPFREGEIELRPVFEMEDFEKPSALSFESSKTDFVQKQKANPKSGGVYRLQLEATMK